ncbi:MAG TPA: hypothetical protein PLS23_21905 [Phycisphaerae bacterium]|nr:hypothetical protein [Phycisphaerae bacterium]
MTAAERELCNEHSGVCVRLGHIEEQQVATWKEIGFMRRLLVSNLISIILVLITLAVNIWLRLHGGG